MDCVSSGVLNTENLRGVCCSNIAYSTCHKLAMGTFLLTGVTAIAYGIFFSAHLITGVGAVLTVTSLFYATLLCCRSLSFHTPKQPALAKDAAPTLVGDGREDTPSTKRKRLVRAEVDGDFTAALHGDDEKAFIAKYGSRIVGAIVTNTFYQTFGIHWSKLTQDHEKILRALLEQKVPLHPFLSYFFQHPYELQLHDGSPTTLKSLFDYLVDRNFDFAGFFTQCPLNDKCPGLPLLAFRHSKTIEEGPQLCSAICTHSTNRQQLAKEILEATIDLFELLNEEEIVLYYGKALIDFFALESKTARTLVPGTGKPWLQFAPYKSKIGTAFRNYFYILQDQQLALSFSKLITAIENFNPSMA